MTCPSCEYNKERAARWRREAYKLSGTPLPEAEEKLMPNDPLIRLAQEAGLPITVEWIDGIMQFASAVAQVERERCAAIGGAAAMAGGDHFSVGTAILRARWNHE